MMAVYDEITSGEIDAESPWTSAVTFKMRDNPESIFEGDATARAAGKGVAIDYNGQYAIFTDEIDTDLVLKPDGVDGAEWGAAPAPGAATIGQTELKTSAQSGSLSVSTPINFAGGNYNFYPEFNSTGGAFTITIAANYNTGGTYRATFEATGSTGGSANYRVRYVTASPPYDLGDGDIGLFVFALIRNNEIISLSVSEDPPWAYNGPTKTRPTIYNKKGGLDSIIMSRLEFMTEKYNRKIANRVIIPTDEDIFMLSEDKRNEYLNEKMTISVDMVRKNKDIDLIPHPFSKLQARDSIILFDPPSTEKLRKLCRAEQDLTYLIQNKYIEIQNDTINRATPVGVTPVKFRWKNSI